MPNNYGGGGIGATFAPTEDAAQMGPMNGQLAGIPAAIKILALRLRPSFANAPAPNQLLQGQGAHGIDPVASAVLATLAKTLGLHAMGLPGGTAGPDPFYAQPQTPRPGAPAPRPAPRRDPGPMDPGDGMDFAPRVIFQPNEPQASPFERRGPIMNGRGRGFGAF